MKLLIVISAKLVRKALEFTIAAVMKTSTPAITRKFRLAEQQKRKAKSTTELHEQQRHRHALEKIKLADSGPSTSNTRD
uniref:Uncharacterized protein n=1 Tax=Caenorhabditis japonica TaxID=281687 RepID=A0A8R1IJ09_CAEJA